MGEGLAKLMSQRLQTQMNAAARWAPSLTAAQAVPVQRQCACGPRRMRTKLALSQPEDRYEQEADRIAEQVTRVSASPAREAARVTALHAAPLIQRLPAADAAASNRAAEGAEVAPTPGPALPTPEPAAPDETSTAGLIVEDEAREVGPGQMRKGEFLDALRAAVCAAADAELTAVGRNTQGCPYIERWIGYYRTRSSQQGERSLRRYAPEAAGARTAREYIPFVAERVRRAVAVWARTGEITGVPEELASQLPGAGILDAIGGFFSGVASAISGAFGGVGRMLGGIFTKARGGGAKEADPQQVLAQLSSGRSLESGVKSRMESAFGYDFSRVRVHTDARAADLSTSLNARAFTIGSNIAFGAGEYQPGTLIGEALIAHELAHVAQQGGAPSSAGLLRQGGTEQATLEEDADASAVNAVISLRSRAKRGMTTIARNAMPRLKSGLGLRRCPTTRPQQRGTQAPRSATPSPQPTTPAGVAPGGQTQAAAVPLPNQILNQVNAQRGNLGALRWNDTLARSATTYCGVMTNTHVFSHTADGSTPLDRVRAAGYFPAGGGGTAGENLYQNPQVFTANDAVTWWMNSPPHRAEIMRPNYEEGGVAVCAGSLTIGGVPRQTNIAVIHFGGSHPILNVSNPTGTPAGGGTQWTITGSVTDNIDPPGSITVQVSLVRTTGGMTVTGLPNGPLPIGAGGAFSFTFGTTGTGSAEVSIGASDTHGNAPRPETRRVRINP